MKIAENIAAFKQKIPNNVTLCAVSKTKPKEDLREAYDAGQRIFGENKIQEMTEKWEALPKDIQWHMIGHIQSNKVKYMAPYVSLIHSADRTKLLKVINKEAEKNDRVIDILLQVKIAEEDSKFGMPIQESEAFLQGKKYKNYPNLNLVGLMGMATFTEDMAQVAKEFEVLKKMYDKFKEPCALKELSMGMSADYKCAIEHGSTMVRIGSAIFGKRN